jgi:hypothetical protein
LRRYGEIRVEIGAKIRKIWSFLEARSKTILHTRKAITIISPIDIMINEELISSSLINKNIID